MNNEPKGSGATANWAQIYNCSFLDFCINSGVPGGSTWKSHVTVHTNNPRKAKIRASSHLGQGLHDEGFYFAELLSVGRRLKCGTWKDSEECFLVWKNQVGWEKFRCRVFGGSSRFQFNIFVTSFDMMMSLFLKVFVVTDTSFWIKIPNFGLLDTKEFLEEFQKISTRII